MMEGSGSVLMSCDNRIREAQKHVILRIRMRREGHAERTPEGENLAFRKPASLPGGP